MSNTNVITFNQSVIPRNRRRIMLPACVLKANLILMACIAYYLARVDMNLTITTTIEDDDGVPRNGYQMMVFVRNALNIIIDRYDNAIRRTLKGEIHDPTHA